MAGESCQEDSCVGKVLQAAVVPAANLPKPTGPVRRALGIDWGRHGVAVLAERHATYVAIPEGRVFESRPISDMVEYAVRLREQYGHFRVYADAENQYGNLDLSNAGFEGRLRIADGGDLKVVIRQMLRLHRNDTGKVVKVDATALMP